MAKHALATIVKAAKSYKKSPPKLSEFSYSSPLDEMRFENFTSYTREKATSTRKISKKK